MKEAALRPSSIPLSGPKFQGAALISAVGGLNFVSLRTQAKHPQTYRIGRGINNQPCTSDVRPTRHATPPRSLTTTSPVARKPCKVNTHAGIDDFYGSAGISTCVCINGIVRSEPFENTVRTPLRTYGNEYQEQIVLAQRQFFRNELEEYEKSNHTTRTIFGLSATH